jgi:hypothetical protein
MTYLFVGEERSPTAVRMGVTWKDGRLAAIPLFEGLRACRLEPKAQEFCNLFYGKKCDRVNKKVLHAIKSSPHPIVALGNRVQRVLTEKGVQHIQLVHPAARGRIRKRERYIAHVVERLKA